MEEQKLDIANKFTEVCNICLDKFNGGITLNIFRSLLNVKCSLSPTWLIEIVGPFLFKFRNEIVARDINFFIERDYADQREEWVKITQGYGESVALAFEANVKASLTDLKNNDVKSLETLPISILKMYCKYLQLCQA